MENQDKLSEKLYERFNADLDQLITVLADHADKKDEIKGLILSLYQAGFADGSEVMESMIKSIISDVAPIVALHVKKDAVGLKAALDDFVARRCVVTGDITIKTHSVH